MVHLLLFLCPFAGRLCCLVTVATLESVHSPRDETKTLVFVKYHLVSTQHPAQETEAMNSEEDERGLVHQSLPETFGHVDAHLERRGAQTRHLGHSSVPTFEYPPQMG